VKTNLGHLEAAAGVAGLIKVVLSLVHGKIPASLHAEHLNPHIPWDRNNLKVARQATAWPRYSGTARAGVSAFGFGGTNAHVIVEEYPQQAPVAAPVEDGDAAAELLVVSGLDEERMREAAGTLAAWLDTDGRSVALAEVAATMGRRRELGQFRGAVAGRSRADLVEGLRRLADGIDGPVVVSGRAEKRGPGARKGPVWVFSGYGSQWAGMAGKLLADEPAFAAAVAELDPLFRACAGFSLAELIAEGRRADGVDQTQIAIFGVQVALAATWRSYGLEPAAIVGHSMGEVAAAVIAGAIDLADGVRIITARSKLLETVSAQGGGSMAVVEMSSAEIDELVASRFPDLGVAVHAAPTQCTVAGDSDQMAEFVAHVESLGRNAWVLNVVGAAHSPAVDQILEPLRQAVASVRSNAPSVPFFSTVLDDPTQTPAFDADYWVANLRRPVRFSQPIAAAAADGYDTYLEISPHPVTVMSIRATLEITPPAGNAGRTPLVLGTLKRDTDDTVTLRSAIGNILTAGHHLDHAALWPATTLIDVPRTTWHHVDFWVEPRRVSTGLPAGSHTLLGVGGELPEGDRYVWRSDIGLESHPWLKDHAVQGVAVLSGTTYAEMAIAAGVEVFGVPVHEVVLSELELDEILTLTDHTTVMTSVKVTAPLTGQVEIFAKRGTGTGGWVRHASAVVVGDAAPAAEAFEVDLAALERGGKSVDVYREFAELGHSYGPAFTGVSDAYAGADGVASARVTLPPEAPHDASFHAHPALLDICLQVLAVAAAGSSYAEQFGAALYLPLGMGRLQVRRGGAVGGHVYASLRPLDERGLGLLGAVRLVDEDGNLIMEARDVYLRRLERSDVPKPLGDKLFTTTWQPALPVQHSGGDESRSWLLLSMADSIEGPLPPVVDPEAVVASLQRAGDTVVGDAVLRVSSATDIAAAVALAGELETPPSSVVLLTPDRRDLPVGLTEHGRAPGEQELLAGIEIARALLDSGLRPLPRLRIATRGALALAEGEAGQPAAASIRGLVRTLAFEHPELRASVVDLDPASGGSAEQLVSELRAGSEHDEVAWRGGTRLTALMTRAPLPEASDGAVVRPGAYIVAGSLSGVGLEFGRWLSRRGARRVVLGGRRAPGEAAQAVIAEMRERGTEVEVVQGDIAAPGVAEAMVTAATAGGMRLCGAAHAANQLNDQLIGSVDAEGISTVWGPKVQGAWRLHEATVALDLDWWLVFSSVASLMGSPGQAAYAAANAWLDSLVSWRRAIGLAGTSINWGPWAEVGKGQDVDWAFMEQLGVSEGMEALDVILGAGIERIGVVRLNAAGAVDVLPSFREVPYFADLVAEAAAVADDGGEEDWAGVAGLRTLPPEEARQVLSERIVSRMAAIMGFHPHQVDRHKPLTQLGFDSLMAVRARNAVQSDLGLPMPVRLLLQGATLTDLEQHLAAELGLGDVVLDLRDAPERVLGARDPSERFLALVWTEALGRDGIGVNQEFTALGGDPVREEQVARLVADRLGEEWTADVLFDVAALHGQPTIERQANLIREALEGNAGRPVRPLRAKGNQPPLFLFHPAGGPTSVYEPLVGLIEGDQPVYGLERLEDIDTVEAKATRYIELIKEIQPVGPYRLGGWSLGGTLAYETAMQLTARGDEVEVVVMLDTILPLELDDKTDSDLLIERLGRFITQMEQTYDAKVDFDIEALRHLDEHEQIRMLKELLESSGIEMSPGVIEHQRTSYLDGRVAERYTPRGYDGRVLLYRATDFNPELVAADARYQRTDEAHGWDEFATALEIYPVPGDHVSMIDRPNIDAVAEHLGAILAQLSLQSA
jgi:phthiocerol/phenolphthiocerol synthesis type-I polyketide synthase D